DSMKHRRRISGAITALIWMSGLACAAVRAATPATTQVVIPATSPTSLPVSFAAAAREVTEYIQAKYWYPKTALYAHSIEQREPETRWGNGGMFPTLVPATRDERR